MQDSMQLPTAIIAADLLMGLAVQRRLNELGKSVPADVSLVNFDDTPAAAHMTPALTVIKQHTATLGARGVQRLIEMIRGDEDVPLIERLPTELIVRESTARPRH
jgi:LacI family transcriptional regulator